MGALLWGMDQTDLDEAPELDAAWFAEAKPLHELLTPQERLAFPSEHSETVKPRKRPA